MRRSGATGAKVPRSSRGAPSGTRWVDNQPTASSPPLEPNQPWLHPSNKYPAWFRGRVPLQSIGGVESGGVNGRQGEACEHNPSLGETAGALLLQAVFWPLTLGLMLAGALYRFLLRVGTSRSPLTFRDPPRWIVRAISKPFRVANPPVVLGAENLRDGVLLRCSDSPTATVNDGHDGRAIGGGSTYGGCVRAPVLLVGNHTLLGLDCVPMLDEVS